jgi:hypothetical protein
MSTTMRMRGFLRLPPEDRIVAPHPHVLNLNPFCSLDDMTHGTVLNGKSGLFLLLSNSYGEGPVP